MKWKTLLNNRKAISYSSTSNGYTYIFGFMNPKCEVEDGEIFPQTHFDFAKIKLRQDEINMHMKDFIHNMNTDFWVTLGEIKEKINWKPGYYTIKIQDSGNYTEQEKEYVEFEMKLHSMSFTDLVALYVTFKDPDYDTLDWGVRIMDSIQIAMYQYLWGTNWYLRHKVLKILKESPFDVSYTELENSYISIESKDWKWGI